MYIPMVGILMATKDLQLIMGITVYSCLLFWKHSLGNASVFIFKYADSIIFYDIA